jgi:hypothetical protein
MPTYVNVCFRKKIGQRSEKQCVEGKSVRQKIEIDSAFMCVGEHITARISKPETAVCYNNQGSN